MRPNQILKLSYFYSYAVSSTFDVLGTGRTIDSICKSINSFLKENKDVNKVKFKVEVGKMAQDKFNQLIIPYLKLPPVEIGLKDLELRLKRDANQDDLEFFLHDLIHEVLEPGSIKKFDKLDKLFSKREEEVLEEMKQDYDLEGDDRFWQENEEGEQEFYRGPEYRLSSEVYSLEDFIDEQVAEALTSKNKVTKNGLYKYMKTTLVGVANQYFDFKWSQSEDFFEEYTNDLDRVEDFLDDVVAKISADTNQVKNPKYKKIADKFAHSAVNWIKQLKQELISKFSDSKYLPEIYFNKIINPLLGKTTNWVGANFNLKQKNTFGDEEFKINPMGEKEIVDLTDDFKMSLLRRWLLAVENEVKNMFNKELTRPGKQLKLNLGI